MRQIPGVSEYEAIKEGDWVAFALAAGIDTAAIAFDLATLGTGCVAEKEAKVLLKEAVEGLSESEAKEVLEKIAEGEAKEVIEELAEGEAKEVLEELVDVEIKEAVEDSAEEVTEIIAESEAKEVVENLAKSGEEMVTKEVDDITEKVQTIYRTQSWKAGKKNVWNEYRLKADEVIKYQCQRFKFFDGKENVWEQVEKVTDTWKLTDPQMPEWIKNYL